MCVYKCVIAVFLLLNSVELLMASCSGPVTYPQQLEKAKNIALVYVMEKTTTKMLPSIFARKKLNKVESKERILKVVKIYKGKLPKTFMYIKKFGAPWSNHDKKTMLFYGQTEKKRVGNIGIPITTSWDGAFFYEGGCSGSHLIFVETKKNADELMMNPEKYHTKYFNLK